MEQNKGLFNGTCNMSSCNSQKPATWYNHGSYAYYCKSCAIRLNNDEHNKRDAQRLFGHELCTEGENGLIKTLKISKMKLTLEINPSDDSSKTLLELISFSREIIKKKLKQITIHDEELGLLQPVVIEEFNCSGDIKINIDF